MPRAFGELDAEQRDERARAGITTIEQAVDRFELHGNSMHVYLQERPDSMEFDVIYPALGTRQRTQFAQWLGVVLNDSGAVDARAPYGTAVPGLCCIVDGLDQVSVALGLVLSPPPGRTTMCAGWKPKAVGRSEAGRDPAAASSIPRPSPSPSESG